MATQIRLRRGTTAQNNAFTGVVGEVTVDTTKNTLVVHNGVTAGGIPLATNAALTTHTGLATGAHAATAISNTPAGNLAATTVQAAVNELDSEKAGLSTANAFTNANSITVNSASPALTVTQTGTGHAFVVEDSASPDTSPFVIDSDGRVGFGLVPLNGQFFRINSLLSGDLISYGIRTVASISSDVTTAILNESTYSTQEAAFTLITLSNYAASQGTIGAGSSVTNQYGFNATGTLIGATKNYGFYGSILTGTGRWNFYANGTAPNYFAGDIRTNTVVTQAISPVNSNVSATLAASTLLGGIATGTPAAGINFTVPTGTNTDAAFQELQTNQTFEWSVINLAAATHAITVLANTTHTVVGNMIVNANSSGRFATRKSAANTFITYRLG